MNKGDALLVELDFTVNGEALQEGEWDDIELVLNSKSYTLKNGDIYWDGEAYVFYLSEAETKKLSFTNLYQLRLLKGDYVISSNVLKFRVGGGISKLYLTDYQGNPSKYNELIERTITSIVSDASVIGDYAFRGCNALTSARFTEATSVGYGAFYGCESLENVTLEKATTIGMEGFASSEIKTLNAPELVNVDAMGLYMATSLKQITAPKLKTIGTTAFASCTSLEEVTFPELTTIEANAFNGCRGMVKADMGNLESISNNAFVNTASLEDLILRKTDSICTISGGLNSNPFTVSNLYLNGGNIYVPNDLIEAYESDVMWSRILSGQANLHFVAIEGSVYE